MDYQEWTIQKHRHHWDQGKERKQNTGIIGIKVKNEDKTQASLGSR
jgi:hypothetical protein